jgi:hypothetical protein
MVLTLDSYTETKNEAEQDKKRLEELEAKKGNASSECCKPTDSLNE